MKLLPILLLTLLLSLGVACSPEPSADYQPDADAIIEARTYVDKGVQYFALGQYEKAIKSYDKAIRLNPKTANAYNKRGVAYQSLGQYDKAIQDYDEAIRLDPENASAYHNRGIANEALGNSLQAEQDSAKSKELLR